jgi:long-chain fatty acid transport protein
MMMNKTKKTILLSALGAFGLLGSFQQVCASGFQIFDQDSNQTGDYYSAGAAGDLNSAGSEFYNPATMTHFKHTTMSLGAVNVYTHIKFTGRTEFHDDLYLPPIIHRIIPRIPDDVVFSINQGGEAQGGGPNYVPNLHVIVPLDSQWTMGFGITTPFGLQTDYDPDSFAANAASRTELKTINLNPSIAYRANKWLSLGLGFDMQYGYGRFDQNIHLQTLPINGQDIVRLNQRVDNTLSDWAYGWNAGMLIDINPDTRFGLAYRSEVKHQARGESNVSLDFDGHGLSASNNNAELDIILPPTTIASLSHTFNKQWTVKGSVYFTQWNKIQEMVLQNVQLAPGFKRNIALAEEFRNTWNFSLGADYHFAKAWTAKMGLGFDESPVNDSDRDIRLPDSDRHILALGLAYQPTEQLRINFGYMHFFTNAAPIDHAAETINFNVGTTTIEDTLAVREIGTSYANADVFGLGVNYQF